MALMFIDSVQTHYDIQEVPRLQHVSKHWCSWETGAIWRCFVLGYMCQGRFSVKESQWAGHVTSARLISKDFHLRQHIFHNQQF